MKEKLIVSSCSLIASLACYFYARHVGKDEVPYVMIGGFIGAYIGETLVSFISKDNDNNPD
ncbi:MAG TPA: hypothetical protein VD905_19695 [Flavobacteriales bacterium]|nr:hypothetical protein [Flavobacteriales bacterium]